MKIIKVSTDLELSIHDFLEGNHSQQNKVLRELIGNNCELYEHVMPKRLYTELKQVDHHTKIKGQCVSMLIDEEGLLKDNTVNLIGSYLYETDKHNQPIVGNILFVGEEWGGDGIDFCGIEESTFKKLELMLNNMIFAMKATKEAMKK